MLKLRKIRASRKENRARTREQLLTSARVVFAKNGYAGATVDLIAENAGYSKGAFYSNFDSKESVFLTLLNQHKEEEVRALEGMLTSFQSMESLLEEVGTYYAKLENDLDWGLLGAEFQIHAGRDPEFAKHILKLNREQQASLGRLIGRLFAKTKQKLPGSPEELAAILIGLCVGLSLQRASDKSAVPKGTMGNAILLVLKSFLGVGN